MSRLCRAHEVMGLPIVTLDTATAVGEVRDVLFDPSRSKVIGFTVRGQGLLSPPLIGLLPIEAVRAIGHDAVMVATEAGIVGQREGMDSAVEQQVEVIGREVVNDAGAALGEVIDVILDVERAEAAVVGYEIEGEATRFIVPLGDGGAPLSTDALILPADVEQYSAGGLNGFRDVLDRARSRGGTQRGEQVVA